MDKLLSIDERNALIALINSQYLSGVYRLTQTSSGRILGTVTGSDFEPASESSLASEIVDAILNELQTATRSRPATRDLAEGEKCPEKILAPLPAGMPDTLEIRKMLQYLLEPVFVSRDMLQRDVVAGDVMWEPPKLFKHAVDWIGQYQKSVRVPRPGEDIPDFPDWQKMCKAMQLAGAEFQRLNHGVWVGPFVWSFVGKVSEYRRYKTCTWEGP